MVSRLLLRRDPDVDTDALRLPVLGPVVLFLLSSLAAVVVFAVLWLFTDLHNHRPTSASRFLSGTPPSAVPPTRRHRTTTGYHHRR